jgi:hypothetical protein
MRLGNGKMHFSKSRGGGKMNVSKYRGQFFHEVFKKELSFQKYRKRLFLESRGRGLKNHRMESAPPPSWSPRLRLRYRQK